VLGREVATLVNEEKPAGVYKVTFDASGLSSGVYFYQLKVVPAGMQAAESNGQPGEFISTKKLVLLK